MGLSDVVSEMEKVDREEKDAVSWLIETVDSKRVSKHLSKEFSSKDLLKDLERLVEVNNEIVSTVEGWDGSTLGLFLLFRYELETQTDLDSLVEHELSDILDRIRNGGKDDLPPGEEFIDSHRDLPQKFVSVLEKLEKMERLFEEDVEQLLNGLEDEALSQVEENIGEAHSVMASRPTVFMEASAASKIIKSTAEVTGKGNGETGGFMHYSLRSGDFFVKKSFHEPNHLDGINLSSVETEKDLLRFLEENFEGIDEMVAHIKSSDDVDIERWKRELSEASDDKYTGSPQVDRMIREMSRERNVMTWHSHPPKNDYSNIVSSNYTISDNDVSHHKDSLHRINGMYHEVLAHPHEGGSGTWLIPQRWKGGNLTSQEIRENIQLLPIWITENGSPLSQGQVRNQFPLIALYNEAIIRAKALNRDAYWQIFVDDNRRRISNELNQNLYTQKDLLVTREASEMTRKIQVDISQTVGL